MDQYATLPTAQLSYEESLRRDERRLIARELHDSTSQSLVILQLELGQLRRLEHPAGMNPIIDEFEIAIRQIRAEIRALNCDRD